jgi:phosphatidylglycerophosphate synthase
MNKNTARVIADSLTWARIFSVAPITLLAWYQLSWWVFGLYIAAAMTDLLDGMFARRGAPPRNDVDLDGIADLVLSFSTLLWFWLLIPGFVSKYWLPYLPILVLLEFYNAVIRVRYHRFGVPHLKFGRFAMALFFSLLPVLIIWGDVPWFVHGVLIIGVASKIQLAWIFWNRAASYRRTQFPMR